MIYVIIAIIAFIIGAVWQAGREPVAPCPRMIRGYSCKGYNCNHSWAEVARAYDAMQEEPNLYDPYH